MAIYSIQVVYNTYTEGVI